MTLQHQGEAKDAIGRAMRDFEEDEVKRACKAFRGRLEVVIKAKGDHIEKS